MKKYLLIAVVCAVALPAVAAARDWSPAQKEVIDHLTVCWKAWAEHPAEQEVWVRGCRPTEDMIWWSTSETLPRDRASNQRVETGIAKYVDQVAWWDMRIHEITVIDDIAIVYYTGQSEVSFKGGRERYRGEDRRCEIFRKIEGKWHFQGGMLAPLRDEW